MAVLGVQMFTLREFTQNEADLDQALKRVSDIGYKSIQVSAFGDISPSVVAELCSKYGLDIGGTHVSWQRYREDTAEVINDHKLWKCQHTAVGMIPPDPYLSLAGMDQFLTELTPVLAELRAAGISFSYHNHSHEFFQFDGTPWLEHLRKAPEARDLNAELDVHWIVAGGGDPVEWIHRWGERMPLLHLKDFVVDEKFRRRFAPVGDGNMNWPAILEAASQHPIEYYFVEQDNCYGEDPFVCLERSYKFLRQFDLA